MECGSSLDPAHYVTGELRDGADDKLSIQGDSSEM